MINTKRETLINGGFIHNLIDGFDSEEQVLEVC